MQKLSLELEQAKAQGCPSSSSSSVKRRRTQEPRMILQRGGKGASRGKCSSSDAVTDPHDPAVYDYIGTIVGNCMKGGAGDEDLHPIFGSGGR